MEKTIRILALVLAVQVVLAVGLQFSGPTLSPATEAEPLVSKSSDQVSKITIADAEDQQVKLKRTDSGWTLTDSGFPADPDKVSQLLKLGRGAVVELDRKVGEAIDIYVNNRLVARGEVVVVEDRLGVTMTEIIKMDHS